MTLIKNPEIAKLLLMLTVLFSVFGVLILGIVWFNAFQLQETVIRHQAALIGAVIETYPEAEHEIIRQIKNTDTEMIQKGETFLSQYGFKRDNLLYTSEHFKANLQRDILTTISLFVLVFVALVGVFFIFIHRHYRNIREITDYLRQIAAGNYSLAIRDNGEGELSILKNEVYKITTMLKEQAETLKREKVRMADSLADISHQLKTPLTSLIVLSDLLEDNPADDVKTEFLKRIRSQLKRMDWLTASLLKLARLEAGTVIMKRDTFPLRSLIDRAIQALSIPLEIKQHHVHIRGDDDVYLIGDFDWTCEALINVLKNHIEHTPEQGGIHIEYEDNPIMTKIVTTDNGKGIDKEDLPHVFNRFYRGKHAKEDSVGIGLAMAYEIVKQQGGDITVKNDGKLGAQFTITFYKQRI